MTDDDRYDISKLVEKEHINLKVEGNESMPYLTAQEHLLKGSSTGPKYYEKPHTPLAVIDGIITVEECEVIRRRYGTIQVLVSNYGKDTIDGYGSALLQPLNLDRNSPEYGQTLHDPKLINAEFFPDLPQKERKEMHYKRKSTSS